VTSDTYEEAEQIVPVEEAEVVSGEADKNLQEAGKERIPIRAILSQIINTFSLSYLDESGEELHVIGLHCSDGTSSNIAKIRHTNCTNSKHFHREKNRYFILFNITVLT
jgi:hypothetical protein